MKTVNIGGNRLGSGNRMETTLHGYERSNHNLSTIFKNTQSAGTLVPFLNLVGLPGDTFDIDLNTIVKTLPTVGPLFGSFKVQLDIFSIPFRLYHPVLHNNQNNIGMNMSSVKLPLLNVEAPNIDENSNVPPEFQQINQSSLLAYLGLRGLGGVATDTDHITRKINAVPYIGYFDIFKNYYANKMEEKAYMITATTPEVTSAYFGNISIQTGNVMIENAIVQMQFYGTNITPDNLTIKIDNVVRPFRDVIADDNSFVIIDPGKIIWASRFKDNYVGATINQYGVDINVDLLYADATPILQEFDLSLIDDMRMSILTHTPTTPFEISPAPVSTPPFSIPINLIPGVDHTMTSIYPQTGLLVKTYQSDIFNNWVKDEFITGNGSIADITKISTTGDSFTVDQLNLSKKVYDLLNRIAVSDGSYQSWLEVTYDHTSKWRAETPIYHGGLSKELTFQEVVSTAATNDKPLATLAGKGVMTDKHKGGKVVVNVDEPGIIMGIVSITPRISYSQGNDWSIDLKTLDDLHKPALDGIGFQDLITEQMAFWDTNYTAGTPTKKSAGKQPAWLNYMTNFDKNYGNFADPRSQKFMTLDRGYTLDGAVIKDLTTYIDPAKYNYAFAQTDLSAMNFWVQIGINIFARRKMSKKLIPNL